MKHNKYIDQNIRNDNDNFNKNWVSSHGFLGDAIVPTTELDVCEEAKADSNAFMMVWLKNIQRLCQMFERAYEYKNFTLLDVGCGSGLSTLFFTQVSGFKKYVGFDFSSKLISLADRNIEIATDDGFNVQPVSFYVEDAKKIILPPERLALFMFNPFGRETVRVFIENNYATLCQKKSVLLYANDVFIEDIVEYGNLDERDDFYNLSLISFE